MAKTITHNESGKTLFGDQDHLQVVQTFTFSEHIFELLSEKSPSQDERRLFDLILNLSIDHGPDAPSAVATIDAAKEGKGFGEAVGEGIAQINERHGGAIEPMMEILYQVQSAKLKVQSSVEEYMKEDKKIPGLGHRLYKDKDPRAELIMETAEKLGIGVEFIREIREIREEFQKQSGKRLVVNIDGAIAAVLCGFGWPAKLGKAVFIIARTVGLCGHYINTALK